MKRTSTLVAAAALIFSAFAAAPASAAGLESRSETVAYGDLDLNSEAGAQTMLRRIEHAARAACFDRSSPMPLTSRPAIRACRMTAMNNAVETLGAPMVTAMHYGRQPNIIVASR
jgi:UrcA family protein